MTAMPPHPHINSHISLAARTLREGLHAIEQSVGNQESQSRHLASALEHLVEAVVQRLAQTGGA